MDELDKPLIQRVLEYLESTPVVWEAPRQIEGPGESYIVHLVQLEAELHE